MRRLLAPLVLFLAACSSPTSPQHDAPAITQAVGSLTCPGLTTKASTGAGTLRAHPVAVRMCADDGGTPLDSPPQPSIRVPLDALVTRTDELVDLVNDLEVDDRKSLVCPAVGGTEYLLAFQWDDGEVRYSRGSLGGCDLLEVGSSLRKGADQVLRAFHRLLSAQRATSSSEVSAHLSCSPVAGYAPAALMTPLVGPQDLTHAVLCAREHGRHQAWRPALPVPAQVLWLVQHDLAGPARPTSDYPTRCRGSLDAEIVAQNDWGDVVAYDPVCRIYLGPREGQRAWGLWRQSPAAHRQIARLFAKALR